MSTYPKKNMPKLQFCIHQTSEKFYLNLEQRKMSKSPDTNTDVIHWNSDNSSLPPPSSHLASFFYLPGKGARMSALVTSVALGVRACCR